MTKPELIVAKARSFIGTKWRHRGRGPNGIDCIGLAVIAVQHAGFFANDRTNYGRWPWKDGLKEELKKHCGDPVKYWKPGDIALMRWENMQAPAHVGIIANYEFGGLSIIHSYSTIAVTEHRIDEKWRKRIIEVYRPCK